MMLSEEAARPGENEEVLVAPHKTWSAVGSMSLCVALLIAAEFLPVSLLTPIAADMKTTVGMTGQAISISGIFAVIASLLTASLAGRFDRRRVLLFLTAVMLASVALIGQATNFTTLMVARALLGVTIGGFWSLSTAVVMRLVPKKDVPKALGLLYLGNALATALAAPIGSYVGGIIGWRGVFNALLPLVLLNLIWQWKSLPLLPVHSKTEIKKVVGLLGRRHVAFAMAGAVLTFAGAFAAFTYFRPFLESITHATVPQLSALLLGLGVAGIAGTMAVSSLLRNHLHALLRLLPLALAALTVAMVGFGHTLWAVAIAMMGWGAINAAIPVAWSTWLSRGIDDEPEAGGGLMVAAIQLSITAGAAFGGWLLDRWSAPFALIGGACLLVFAALVVGSGSRLTQAHGDRNL